MAIRYSSFLYVIRRHFGSHLHMINFILYRDVPIPDRPCDLSPAGVYHKAAPDHDDGSLGRTKGGGIPMFSRFISLTAAQRNELLTLVLKGSDDLTYPGCVSEVVDVYQRSYLQIVTRSVRASLSANRISRQAVAEVLARNVGHTNRTLKDGAFTADQILRLERAFGALDNDIRRIKRWSLPAIEALINVEDWLRTVWLPQIRNVPNLAAPKATLADATIMTAYCRSHIDDLHDWATLHKDDLSRAASDVGFRRLLRAILDDALVLATRDHILTNELLAWPCPLQDSRPFLRFFAELLRDRHFTWLLAYVPNESQVYPE